MKTLVVKKKSKTALSISPKRKALIKGFKELRLAEEGKLSGKLAADLLKELRNEQA